MTRSCTRPESPRPNEWRAILTRAAEQEARRQAAAARGDHATVEAAEDELRRLWRAFGDVGQS